MKKRIPVYPASKGFFIGKKWIAAVLCLAMLLSAAAALADNDFNVDPYKEYDTLFSIDVDTDSGVAFVETKESGADLAFSHKYEVESTYSIIYTDILVIDYFKSSRYPVVRTWICYAGSEAKYFDSITFELNGNTYTFTDVADPDRIEKKDYGYSEKLLIKYGKDNSSFFADVMSTALVYVMDDSEDKAAPTMKVTLHGLEDVETEVSAAFWEDFAMLTLPFLSNDGAWLSYIGDIDGTPCKVIEAAQ